MDITDMIRNTYHEHQILKREHDALKTKYDEQKAWLKILNEKYERQQKALRKSNERCEHLEMQIVVNSEKERQRYKEAIDKIHEEYEAKIVKFNLLKELFDDFISMINK